MGGDSITFTYRHRKEIIIGVIILIITITLISITTYFILKNNNKKKDEEPIILKKKENIKDKEKEDNTLYKVDIKGEIINPGIYTLKSSSRVIDVINIAGGLSENADTSVINLSKKISDEMVIIIYSKEQVANFIKVKEEEKLLQDKCNQIDENSLINDACINQSNNSNGKISINNSSKEELMTLPGIGESKANDIIKYREQNGPFKTIEDLKNISGIGDSIFAKIKENITI